MKKNYKMTIRYDGTRYYGWEHQPGNPMTIQGKLETVLGRMLGETVSAGETVSPREADSSGKAESKDGSICLPVTVIGAGRTDAGVHARAMTANVLLDTPLTEEEIRVYMNRYRPDDISVDELKVCADRFHSRFKAKGKTYCYTFWCGEGKPVFDRKYVTVLEKRPDVQRMRKAAEWLTGMHDYKSFCGNSHIKKSTVRVVDSIEVKSSGPYIRIYYHGNGFLQNMVRIMTGTLLEAGYGRLDPDAVPEILEACDRTKAGPTAPAQGLTLLSVDY